MVTEVTMPTDEIVGAGAPDDRAANRLVLDLANRAAILATFLLVAAFALVYRGAVDVPLAPAALVAGDVALVLGVLSRRRTAGLLVYSGLLVACAAGLIVLLQVGWAQSVVERVQTSLHHQRQP